eukprot:Rmarinus@m.15291
MAETSSRGIPKAEFIEDVASYCEKEDAATVLRRMDELYSKYKLMEMSLVQEKNTLKSKTPEIKKTLQMIKFLSSKQGEESPEARYMLADNVYTKAKLSGGNTCYLWLGANVMLEYTFEDAITLLEKRLEGATEQLKKLNQDIAFLREQQTTTEVSIARVHNYDVKMRRQKPSEK